MQEVFEGTVAVVTVNVIESGSHVAANINTSTTRLSTHPSAVPTVTNPDTGVYKIKFSGLSPALSVSDNDDGVSCVVNGDIGGTAWSAYHIPVKVAATMRGTDSANTVAPVDVSSDVSAILADTNELQQNQGDWATATGFSTHSASDVVTALQAVANDFKADISALASQASVDTIDSIVDAIKAKTDQLAFTVAGQVDANALTGGGSGGATAAEVYTYFTDGSREDAFKADVSGLSTFDPSTDEVTTDAASRTASQASGFSTHAASDVVSAMQAVAGDFKATGFSTHAASDVVTAMQVVADDFKADVSGVTAPTAAEVADAVWSESINSHVSTGTAAEYLDLIKHSSLSFKGSVTGATGNSLTLGSGVTSNDQFNDMMVYIYEGTGYGQARFIDDSLSSSNTIVLTSFWTTQPDTTSKYMIIPRLATAAPTAGEIYSFFISGSNEDAFKADVSGLATQTSLNAVSSDIFDIKADTNELQQNQGDWATADVSSLATQTVLDSVNFKVDSILADTNELQGNQGDWATADVSGLATSAEISALSIPTTAQIADAVWEEQLGDHSLTVGSAAEKLAGLTSGGGGSGGDDAATIYAYFTASSREDVFKTDVSALATQSSVDSIDGDIQNIGSDVSTILADTNELQTNQNNWITATGFSTHSAADVVSGLQAVSGDFKADVSSLAQSSELPSNFDTLIIGTGADAGKVTTSNPAAGAGSSHTAQDVANLILATPANKLATNATGQVEASNMRGTDSASTHSAADVYAYFTDGTREDVFKADVSNLSTDAPTAQEIYNLFTSGSNEDAFKADISGLASQTTVDALATQSSVNNIATTLSALNDPTPAEIYAHFTTGSNEDAFKADVSVLATTSDIDALNDSTPAEIYNYMTQLSRADAFKADVSGLSTFDPSNDTVANVTTVATVSNAVETDTASRLASQADLTGLATQTDVSNAKNEVRSDISALNDFNPSSDTVARVTLVDTTTDVTNQSSGGGASASDIYDYFTNNSRENVFKADVSSLLTVGSFNAALPSRFSDLLIGNNADLGKVVTSNPAAGSGSAHTAQDVANLILATPANKLVTNATGQVETSNLDEVTNDGESAADIYTYFTAAGRPNVFKADVSGLSTFDPFTDTVQNVNEVALVSGDVNTNLASRLASQADTSGLASQASVDALNDVTAADVYAEFTTGPNADAFKADISTLNDIEASEVVSALQAVAGDFKADVSSLASQSSIDGLNDLSGSDVAGSVWNALSASYSLSGSFGEFLDGNVSNAGGTGNGLHRVDVLVQDSSLAAVPNARISVDGTTYELSTKADGTATFMLDSGVYTLRCAPPEGYNVPSDNVITITTTDISNTFTVSESSTPPSSSTVPWIG